jgi:hypothetical protein
MIKTMTSAEETAANTVSIYHAKRLFI